ncbi:alpha/beta hydrolase [Propioniciclava soli]|uniref:Alpha/beta hydrolase n=1 Tax=Propioniciclava soli TaxID=2775081 RepID=A0ABZ3C7F7_9ACTN
MTRGEVVRARARVDLGWGEVSYVTWEPDVASDAPPVVLLHGGGLDNALLSWEPLGAALAAAGHRVVAPDHPGFGHSALPPWRVSQERLVAYVGEFLDALGLGSVVLGGISMGGGMSLGYALDHPDRVAGLLLFGTYGLADRQTSGLWARPTHWLSWALVRTGALGALTGAYLGHRRLLVSSLRGIVRNPAELTSELVDAVVVEASRPDAFAAFGQWQRDQVLLSRMRTNYTPRLAEIGAPVLLVHGERDSGVPLASIRDAAGRLPDATLLVVVGAGHWVQRDRPDIVIPAVAGFLRGGRS